MALTISTLAEESYPITYFNNIKDREQVAFSVLFYIKYKKAWIFAYNV